MKKIILFAAILRIILVIATISLVLAVNAQSVALNTNGASADASAMLDVSSTSKGFLPPRMTTIQRTGILSPANGLMVFDTDTKSVWYFSTTWKEINNNGGGGGGSTFTLPYNATADANGGNLFAISNIGFSNGGTAIYGLSYTAGGIGVQGVGGNGGTAIYGQSNSDFGKAAIFENVNTTGGDTTVKLLQAGSGVGLSVELPNLNNYHHAISTISKGSGNALYAQAVRGSAGYFYRENNSSSSLSSAVNIENAGGYGDGLNIITTNASNSNSGIYVEHDGLGNGLWVNSSNSSNSQFAIRATANSTTAGGLEIGLINANGTGKGITVSNEGSGDALYVAAKKGRAAYLTNLSTTSSVLFSAINTGTNYAGEFLNLTNTNSAPAVHAYTNGTGPGILVDNFNASSVSSLATFKKNGGNVARIDGTGKGFFNGGTQNGGADLAEAFDVIGSRNEYEAGDVLVISTDKDRAVEKSFGAYSTLVAGVYATKPGVLLTEENIETNISDKVPMGVVGVIPTKVCIEGGEIKRGDLLVTSSIPGVAMKADIEKVKPGQVIGKALENFNSSSAGKIKVLVSVK